MPPKAKIPAPIDRPLSRAYLREFSGWSTAYPPTVSEPTSLRIMENVQINRDGSARIRPGLKYLSYDGESPLPPSLRWVGSHEAFYLDDGRKAYLFHARLGTGEVAPYVLIDDEEAGSLQLAELEDAAVGFSVEDGVESLRFTPETTYVKYLQIDNKIFALSNAGEPMRLFYVGQGKWAKALQAITVPQWEVDHKPIVVHPDASWINGTGSTVYRENLMTNPSFEVELGGWNNSSDSTFTREDLLADSGSYAGRLKADVHGSNGNLTGWQKYIGKVWARHKITGLAPGRRYEFSAALRIHTWGESATRARLVVQWLNSDDESLGFKEIPCYSLRSFYKRYYSGLLMSPPNTVACRLYVSMYPSAEKDSILEVDSVMVEATVFSGRPYFDGSTTPVGGEVYQWVGAAHDSISQQVQAEPQWVTQPTPETKTGDTLISSTSGDNDYSVGYFYTFYNEIGESEPSQPTIVRVQRPVSAWRWETANAQGEPSGTETTDPDLAADQLVISVPEEVFNTAIEQRALGWNLYMFTWSDQDVVPVEARMIGRRVFAEGSDWQQHGWIRHSPKVSDWPYTAPLPSQSMNFNYTDPSRGGQGIVAADRMILVYDPTDQARVSWTSNQQGSYTDFTASRGGGFKTLTSGNLQVPATVKLWQNPQSADTLTVLTLGTDARSTGYYMAPAQVAQQSEATNIMAFEETTATPGTASPYGCEVLNNALYHPLDELLMKSTASNYNINHKSVTEQIDDKWTALVDKHHIVSSQLDNRIYFIVHNPDGAELEDGCWGNEIWVFDAGVDSGTWSRFLIQAHSLRKIEHNDQTYMSVTRPDGLYILDPEYDRDDINDGFDLLERAIPWKLETNTQGANRAHDAWCHLQQVGISLGNWQGSLRYGIRSWDVNGKPVEISKIFRDLNPPSSDGSTYDIEDQLQIRRDLKEWFFFAESVDEES